MPRQKEESEAKRYSTPSLVFVLLFLFSSAIFASLIAANLPIIAAHYSLYLTISVALAGGSLTLASIVLTYYLGEESRLLASIRMYLRDCLSNLESWRSHSFRAAPHLQRIYKKTEQMWSKRLSRATPIGKRTLVMVFLPFAVLIISIFGLIIFVSTGDVLWMFPASFFLYLAIALLLWEFIVLIRRLLDIQSMKMFFGSGKLWLSQINSEKHREPLKKITYQVGRSASTKVKNVKIKLSFKGEIRNGFFHAVLIGDRLRKPVSDTNTYFQDNIYTPTLKVLVDPKFDIGVIQGPCKFENTHTEMILDLCLEGLLANGRHKRERVRRIEIGVYEDPVDLPSGDLRGTKFTPTGLRVERHLIDHVIIDLQYTG